MCLPSSRFLHASESLRDAPPSPRWVWHPAIADRFRGIAAQLAAATLELGPKILIESAQVRDVQAGAFDLTLDLAGLRAVARELRLGADQLHLWRQIAEPPPVASMIARVCAGPGGDSRTSRAISACSSVRLSFSAGDRADVPVPS